MRKSQRVLSCLLVLTMLLGLLSGLAVTASAEDTSYSGQCGPNVYYSYDDVSGTLSIFGTGPMYDYTTAPDDERAPWCRLTTSTNLTRKIKRVIVEEGVTTIGDAAFASLLACTEYSLPSTLTTIGKSAFFQNTALPVINLPTGLLRVKYNAFSTCSGLRSSSFSSNTVIEDPNGTNYDLVRASGKSYDYSVDAGGYCGAGTALTEVKWEYSASTKTLRIFPVNTSGLTTYSVQDYANAVGTPWYANAAAIETVEFSSYIRNIGDYSFAYMTNLRRVVIGNSVETIGSGAFTGCTGLSALDIPSSVKNVRSGAFLGATSVTVTVAGARTDITFAPGGDVTFGSDGRADKINGNDIVYLVDSGSVTGTFGSGLTFMFLPASGALHIYGTGVIPNYITPMNAPWYEYKNSGGTVLFRATDIKSLTIHEGVSAIGTQAFGMCTAMQRVTLPASLKTVGANAFSACVAVADATHAGSSASPVTFGDGNSYVKDKLRYLGSSGVTDPVVPTPTNQQGTIGNITWVYTVNDKALRLMASAENSQLTPTGTLPWTSFATGIEQIQIGANIVAIGPSVFANLPNLNYVKMTSVVTLGDYAFYNTPNLKAIYLPQSVTTLGSAVFDGRTDGLKVTAYTPRPATTPLTMGANTDLTVSYGVTTDPTNPTPVTPISGSCGTYATWSFNTSTGVLTISGSGTTYTFSSTGLPGWSTYMSQIRRVEVGNGITGIGSYAFYGASQLTAVTLSQSVSAIGDNAFLGAAPTVYATSPRASSNGVALGTGNTNLRISYTGSSSENPGGQTVTGTIPSTGLTWSFDLTTGALTVTGTGAIPDYASANATPWSAYATRIKSVTLQTGVTGIGSYAFAGMTALRDVYLPETLTSIGAYAFSGATSLVHVKIPTAVTYLGVGAFRECTSLTAIEIPQNILTISDEAFFRCEALETVTFNEGLVEIGAKAFYGCKSIKTLTFPSTLTRIGREAFYGCTGLTGVIFNTMSVLTIGADAFGNCTSLIKAIFLYGSDNVDFGTGNSRLKSAEIARIASGVSAKDNISWTVDRATGILTLSGNGPVTDSTAAWIDELKYADTLVLTGGITGIGDELLKENPYIATVRMSNTVRTIGVGAFEGCSNLAQVYFPDSLQSMGARAFKGCDKLRSIGLPSSLREIPEDAFSDCGALTAVVIPQGTTTIGADAFADCPMLDTVTIPATVTSIERGAFSGCRNLKTIYLSGDGIRTLNKNIFNGCSSIQTVYYDGTVAWETLSANADPEIKRANVIRSFSLTIYYVYEDGTQAAPPVTVHCREGEMTPSVTSPEIDFYQPDRAVIDPMRLSSSRTDTVTYRHRTYTVTVQYLDKNGEPLATSQTFSVVYGGSLTVEARTISGYAADATTRTLTNVTGDAIVKFTYTPNTYKITVICKDTDGREIRRETVDAAYGSSVTVTAPTIKGYTSPLAKTKTFDKIIGNETCEFVYTAQSETLTIRYVDEDGMDIAPKFTKEYKYGDKVSVPSPVVEGYTPEFATYTIDKYDGQTEVKVVYTIKTCIVTIHFVEEGTSNGYKMAADIRVPVKYGETLSHTAPVIEGYVADRPTLNIPGIKADTDVYVTYSRAYYGLTIHYVDADGNEVESHKYTVQAGTSYTYTYDKSGKYEPVTVAGTMGLADQSVTVTVEKVQSSSGSAALKTVLVIVAIVAVLGASGTAFYFFYLKKK